MLKPTIERDYSAPAAMPPTDDVACAAGAASLEGTIMTTISDKLRRALFGRNAKDGTEKSGTIKQGDDRSPAASGSRDDDRNAAALAAFYSLLLGTEDERQTQQLTPVPDPTARPWSAICHLQSNYSDDESKTTTNGTGFLISDTTVLTAAHNLCWVKN